MNKKEYDKAYAQSHKEEIKEYQKAYQIRNRKHLLEQAKIWRQNHPEQSNAQKRRYTVKTKADALTHYGNGKLACVTCGESRIDCLSIDHIDGKGAEHRRTMPKGTRIYIWLKRNNYPEGFQTLCMNCQFIKRGEESQGWRIHCSTIDNKS